MWKINLPGKRFVAISTAVFVILVTFFDRNSLLNSRRLGSRIRDLEAQREYYLQRIEEDSLAVENLKDVRYLEKFARENYYMKHEGEQIYLVK